LRNSSWNMQSKFYWLIIVLFLSNIAYAQKPEFFREDLSFGLDTAFFSVNGDYYFRNSSAEYHTYTIVFPVRSTNSVKPIDTILVFDHTDDDRMLKVSVKDTLATFVLDMSPHSEKIIKIIYRQRHDGKKARYILTTTKLWEKPFNKADYNLVVKKNIEITDFSIKPDSKIDFGDAVIYYWKREHYLPENDFEINFYLLKDNK